MHTNLITTSSPHIATQYSLYRLKLSSGDYKRFTDVLWTIRPKDSKVMLIGPGNLTTRVHVILSEDELLLLTLSFRITYHWLQTWEYT